MEKMAATKELLVRFATGNDACMLALLDTFGQLVKELHYPKGASPIGVPMRTDLMYGLVAMLTSDEREIVTVATFERWFGDADRCPAMMMNDGRLKQLLSDLQGRESEEEDSESGEMESDVSPPPLGRRLPRSRRRRRRSSDGAG